MPRTTTSPLPRGEPAPSDSAPTGTTEEDQTVDQLEERLTEQVELLAVMSEIAEISRRTLALEQQRELTNTRGLFFGFVVSLAVLVAGWAPLVAATWSDRLWTVGLTLATCLVAGAVYVLVGRGQTTDAEGAE